MRIPIVAMWGMGEDSFQGIRRWIKHRRSRDFDLEDLIILTSQTIAEFSYTGFLNEIYALPLFAEHHLRVVQITKAGPRVEDGYVILSDTRSPRKLWLYGWATPPLSPMSEQIPYLVEPLYSPLHPLWNPDAIWDQNYHPENFGPPDSLLHYDSLPGEFIAHQPRTHRHHVCRLEVSNYPANLPDELIQLKADDLDRLGIGNYYQTQGTLPQFREDRRDCSPKFKGMMNEQFVADEIPRLWGLGQNCHHQASIPQFSAQGQVCSDQYKAEPLKQYLEQMPPIYGLGQDLQAGGVVPQLSKGQGRGKCSDKSKASVCSLWLESATTINPSDQANTAEVSESIELQARTDSTEWISTQTEMGRVKLLFHAHDLTQAVPLPPYVRVAIFFNANELYRRDRAEFAIAKKKQSRKRPTRPTIYRIDSYPLIEQPVDRLSIERSNQAFCGEKFYNSACSFCPFSGIAGPTEKVLKKHEFLPNEAGYALLTEFIARCLNPKQTLYPNGRSLLSMLQDAGNWEAILNWQERLERLAWAVYRVQGITSKTEAGKAAKIPYRRTQIITTGTIDTIWEQFDKACDRHQATIVSDEQDGMRRGWIENRTISLREPITNTSETSASNHSTSRTARSETVILYHLRDLIAVCPHIPIEKHRPGWHKEWERLHHEQLTLF